MDKLTKVKEVLLQILRSMIAAFKAKFQTQTPTPQPAGDEPAAVSGGARDLMERAMKVQKEITDKAIRRETTLYWSLVSAFFLAAITGVHLLLGDLPQMGLGSIGGSQLSIEWKLLGYQGLLLLFVFGYRIVDEDKVGAKVFLGYPLQHLSSGPAHMLPFLCWFRKESRLIHRWEFPADPQNIFRGDTEVVPEGKFPPIRITSAQEPGDNALNRRVTYEATPIVTLAISNYPRFLRKIGRLEGRPGENSARSQIEDVAVSLLNTYLPKKTADWVLKNKEEVDAELTRTLIRETSNWGVIVGGTVKTFGFNHSLNDALTGVAEAELNAAAAKSEGVGEGDRRREFVTREAQGVAAAAGQLGLQPVDYFAAQVARDVAKDGNAIIVGVDGLTQLAGLAKGLGIGNSQQPTPKK